jgi:predicted transposase YdaD
LISFWKRSKRKGEVKKNPIYEDIFQALERKLSLIITEEMIKQDSFFQEGLERGKLEAKKEDILNLYGELNLSPKQIAKVLKVPKELVKEVIQTTK